ncbi:MAG: 2-oxoacid:acceptor oxidoreductase family protein [Patescibacteria group bacterium]|nr:2-oxoacid:acceptor oxidoreductase family protein [Patescibacteria group bacterium]
MIQVRIHGRGGQGVVTAAELLALAAFNEGYFAQAFPAFGVERSGAPIQSFVRINNEAIITREQVQVPDILIVQDASLLNEKEVLLGLKRTTQLIVNSPLEAEEISKLLKNKIKSNNIYSTPATDIALNLLGKNIVNTVILGAFIKHNKIIKLKTLLQTVAEKFADKGESLIKKNQSAITAAYNYVSKK